MTESTSKNLLQSPDTLQWKLIQHFAIRFGDDTNYLRRHSNLPANLIERIRRVRQEMNSWRREIDTIADWIMSIEPLWNDAAPGRYGGVDKFLRDIRGETSPELLRFHPLGDTLDRRATCDALLRHKFDNVGYWREGPHFMIAFYLSCCFNFEDRIRRLYAQQRSDRIRFLTLRRNDMTSIVEYWMRVMQQRPDPFQHTIATWRYFSTRSFAAAMLQSYWSMIVEKVLGGVESTASVKWAKGLLRQSLTRDEYALLAGFVWSQLPEHVRSSMVNKMGSKYSLITDTVGACGGDGGLATIDLFNSMWRVVPDRDQPKVLRKIVDHLRRIVVDEQKTRPLIGVWIGALNGRLAIDFSPEILDELSSLVETLLPEYLQHFRSGWDSTKDVEKTRLSNDAVKVFGQFVGRGNVEMAAFVWSMVDEFQQFQIVFDDACFAFRTSCVNGYLRLVRLMWEWVPTEHRCHMIKQNEGESIVAAFNNGRSTVVEYLWTRMDKNSLHAAISFVDKSLLINYIRASQSTDALLKYLTSMISPNSYTNRVCFGYGPGGIIPPIKSMDAEEIAIMMRKILIDTLLDDEARGLGAIRGRVETDEQRAMLDSLVNCFDGEEKDRIRSVMGLEEEVK